jgi:hypothetical protein
MFNLSFSLAFLLLLFNILICHLAFSLLMYSLVVSILKNLIVMFVYYHVMHRPTSKNRTSSLLLLLPFPMRSSCRILSISLTLPSVLYSLCNRCCQYLCCSPVVRPLQRISPHTSRSQFHHSGSVISSLFIPFQPIDISRPPRAFLVHFLHVCDPTRVSTSDSASCRYRSRATCDDVIPVDLVCFYIPRTPS